MTTLDTRNARLLMCRPEHFAVSYAINPWMDPTSWARDNRAHAAAAREWADLHRTLTECGADIDLVPSVPGLPDLVFTANAAVVLDRQVLLARFRHPERRREEVHFEAAFRSLQARGVIDSVCKLPEHVVLEGAGDCVWDETRKLFWMGYGPRSDAAARHAVADTFGRGRGRARACGRALLSHGHGALRTPARRGHVSARCLHQGGPGRDPRAGRAGAAHRDRQRETGAVSQPTPSASAIPW